MPTLFRRVAAATAIALTFGLVVGSAAPANAETLRRHGAKTVKILPVASTPAGAQVVSATVTVKKGKKLVAWNRTYYKAKKGTYKVASSVVYRTLQSYTVQAGDVFADCRVASKEITSDRTERHTWSDGTFFYSGQVTVRYTGECVDDFYLGGSSQRLVWAASWSDDDYVATDDTTDPSAATRAAMVLADTYYKVGDVDLVTGPDLSALPPATMAFGDQQTVVKTRTVKVK